MLIYSRAVPESDEEPLQWPEDVVVRGSTRFFLSIFVLRCIYRHPLHLSSISTAGRSASQSAFPRKYHTGYHHE